ncbi:MAG TPA: SRPBCC domain-containing protein [Acidimicrobiia bacterium]|jgi:uncharacterized protein YndB with AHSA1/START domain|nr:SRPBCC domain-containing protein [Acidimicrobiia bacterium]
MTEKTTELVITRVFNAPRELVFKCITEPEHLTHFWGPVGMRTPIEKIKVDLRIGGVFETVMVNEATGDEYPSRGVYTEIDPPAKLAWTEPDAGMTSTTTFTDLGDGRTEVRIHQTNVPEMYATEEAQAGFNSSLDRFAAYLATIA